MSLWTDAKLCQLAHLYSQYDNLWDCQHPYYYDLRSRIESYFRICEGLRMPVSMVKNILREVQKLRLAYVTELRKVQIAEMGGYVYRPRQRWFYALDDFLYDHLDEDLQIMKPPEQFPMYENCRTPELNPRKPRQCSKEPADPCMKQQTDQHRANPSNPICNRAKDKSCSGRVFGSPPPNSLGNSNVNFPVYENDRTPILNPRKPRQCSKGVSVPCPKQQTNQGCGRPSYPRNSAAKDISYSGRVLGSPSPASLGSSNVDGIYEYPTNERSSKRYPTARSGSSKPQEAGKQTGQKVKEKSHPSCHCGSSQTSKVPDVSENSLQIEKPSKGRGSSTGVKCRDGKNAMPNSAPKERGGYCGQQYTDQHLKSRKCGQNEDPDIMEQLDETPEPEMYPREQPRNLSRDYRGFCFEPDAEGRPPSALYVVNEDVDSQILEILQEKNIDIYDVDFKQSTSESPNMQNNDLKCNRQVYSDNSPDSGYGIEYSEGTDEFLVNDAPGVTSRIVCCCKCHKHSKKKRVLWENQ